MNVVLNSSEFFEGRKIESCEILTRRLGISHLFIKTFHYRVNVSRFLGAIYHITQLCFQTWSETERTNDALTK